MVMAQIELGAAAKGLHYADFEISPEMRAAIFGTVVIHLSIKVNQLPFSHPETGFFGMTYILDGGATVRTTDLSLTFHMVRYAPHLVRWWPALADTLFAIKEQQYPQGWLENGTMTDHNNYDVVELLARGWPYIRADQRQRAGPVVAEMLDWCLYNSVAPNGEVRHPDKGDMVPDSYYFAAAFLDTVGFFDRSKRFWTDRGLGDPNPIRDGMIAALARFSQDLTVIDDTLERLGGPRRALSNAVL